MAALKTLIEGFESFLALEVLATVDFLKKDNAQLNKQDILKAIAEWSPRKAQQMREAYVTIALERLNAYENRVLA